MARGKCLFKETDVKRALNAVKSAGETVAGVKYESDGTFTVITGTPEPAKDERPNSFDRVLGGPNVHRA
jgi:hypothetical protein